VPSGQMAAMKPSSASMTRCMSSVRIAWTFPVSFALRACRWAGRTFEATSIIGESTRAAYLDAGVWLVKRHDG
jgi:hypothetical protein